MRNDYRYRVIKLGAEERERGAEGEEESRGKGGARAIRQELSRCEAARAGVLRRDQRLTVSDRKSRPEVAAHIAH